MVYFIQAGENGPIKIGYAHSPENRLAQLQTAQPEQLRILKTIPGDHVLEREIHGQLKAFRLKGEWFDSDPEVMRFIAQLGSVAEIETEHGHAWLVLWRDTEKSPTDLCPFCFRRHIHGIGDGHRGSHCALNQPVEIEVGEYVLNSAHGYILKTRTASDAIQTTNAEAC